MEGTKNNLNLKPTIGRHTPFLRARTWSQVCCISQLHDRFGLILSNSSESGALNSHVSPNLSIDVIVISMESHPVCSRYDAQKIRNGSVHVPSMMHSHPVLCS